MVNSAQATEKRECALEGKVHSITQRTAATRKALEHPRRWRHQRRSARLNCWEDHHQRTGLAKETISAGADKIDVRAPRKGGREDNTQVHVLLDQGQGHAAKMYAAVRATAQRTKDHGGRFGGAVTKREAPANAPSMHRATFRSACDAVKMTKSSA